MGASLLCGSIAYQQVSEVMRDNEREDKVFLDCVTHNLCG